MGGAGNPGRSVSINKTEKGRKPVKRASKYLELSPTGRLYKSGTEQAPPSIFPWSKGAGVFIHQPPTLTGWGIWGGVFEFPCTSGLPREPAEKSSSSLEKAHRQKDGESGSWLQKACLKC